MIVDAVDLSLRAVDLVAGEAEGAVPAGVVDVAPSGAVTSGDVLAACGLLLFLGGGVCG